MITIHLRTTKSLFKLEVEGHSLQSSEPCARVTTVLELLTLLVADIDENEKRNGYTLLTFDNSKFNEYYFDLFSNYLKSLKDIYNNTIKILED